jgi:hypothetical protein
MGNVGPTLPRFGTDFTATRPGCAPSTQVFTQLLLARRSALPAPAVARREVSLFCHRQLDGDVCNCIPGIMNSNEQ